MSDLVADELARLRPGSVGRLPAVPWPADLRVDEDGLGLDSLERLSVATALSEALHLHESGLGDLLLARRRFGEWVEVVAQSLAAYDRCVTFRTSGSSGLPKSCTHRLAHLDREADHWAEMLASARRVICAVPAHHIYGFIFTLLLPARLADIDVIDVRQRTPLSLAPDLREGDVVIGHPAFWSLVARHVATLPRGIVGVTSTAPCPDATANALGAAGLSRLIQVYGSSETAGIGWRSSPIDPYRLLPQWVPVDPDAADASTDSLRRSVFEVDPDQAEEAGMPDRYPMPDHVEWVSPERFRVIGRKDSAVQVGGINVFAARVREVLMAHPSVADAAVRLMAPAEGDRLKAFVVLRDLDTPTELATEALLAWVQQRLTTPERPRSFVFGASLPVGALGKSADWAIDRPST